MQKVLGNRDGSLNIGEPKKVLRVLMKQMNATRSSILGIKGS
jgi:hypothetical protein